MKKTIAAVIMICLASMSLIEVDVQAQQRDVSALTFGLEVSVGMLTAWGATAVGQLFSVPGMDYWAGTFGATIGVGLTGLLMGHNGNWFTAYFGSLAGWTLASFFTTGFFDPNGSVGIPFLGARMSGKSAIFLSSVFSAAFIAAATYNF